MSLFYSYTAGSLRVLGPQAHLQESSYSCSHNHWFSICTALFACSVQSTRPERYRYWTIGCVNSCTNSPEDGSVGPKHVETQQYTNKIVTSVGFHSICWKDARYKKLKIWTYYVLRICTVQLYCTGLLTHESSVFTVCSTRYNGQYSRCAECVSVFCMMPTIQRDYLHKRCWLIDLYKGDVLVSLM